MSYHIYTTDGIILKRSPFGEANLLLNVLTKDLGLITASARSARVSASKLRPALQEYGLVSLSCVKGKGGWKITNVAGNGNLFFDYPEYCHKILARIGSVLLQMITGESPHPEIFLTVKDALSYLRNIPEENLPDFETILVLRILFQLGYVAKNEATEKFLNDTLEWSPGLLSEAKTHKLELVALINKALKESQL